MTAGHQTKYMESKIPMRLARFCLLRGEVDRRGSKTLFWYSALLSGVKAEDGLAEYSSLRTWEAMIRCDVHDAVGLTLGVGLDAAVGVFHSR